MPFAENDGVEIAYEVIAGERDETVVFIGGLGYGRWFWEWQRTAVEGDYRVVLWDNRGIGESDTPEGPYSIEEMAADCEAVLAAAGIEEAHLVGVSMGGMIAQEYALEYDRARSLVLLSTNCGGEERIDTPDWVQERMLNPPADAELREQIRYKMEPAFTDEFWNQHQDVIERILDYRTADPVPNTVVGWQAQAALSWGIYDDLPELTEPTLLMHGEADNVAPVENVEIIAEQLKNAEVVRFEDGGSHLFMIERAEDVNKRIRQFIDEH